MELAEIISEQYGISKFPKTTSEAMAYIPYQPDNPATYTPMQGFAVGTMHPTLNKPFYGQMCGGKND